MEADFPDSPTDFPDSPTTSDAPDSPFVEINNSKDASFEEEEEIVVLRQHERLVPGAGFSGSHLTSLFGDPHEWTYANGEPAPTPVQLRPRPGWRWVQEEWSVLPPGRNPDAKGFCYGSGFVRRGTGLLSGARTLLSTVRQRQFVRTQRGPAGLRPRSVSAMPQNLLQRMAEEFCPTFILHSRDEYRPSSFEEYLKHCELYYGETLVLGLGEVTPQTLVNQEVPITPADPASPCLSVASQLIEQKEPPAAEGEGDLVQSLSAAMEEAQIDEDAAVLAVAVAASAAANSNAANRSNSRASVNSIASFADESSSAVSPNAVAASSSTTATSNDGANSSASINSVASFIDDIHGDSASATPASEDFFSTSTSPTTANDTNQLQPPQPPLSPTPQLVAKSRGELQADGRVATHHLWHLKCADISFHHGMPQAEWDSIPMYVRVTDDTVRGEEVFALTYILFFPYNGATEVLVDEVGHINSLQGGHEADVEHVRVHVSKASGQLHSVYFSAHRERDGMLRLAHQVLYTPSGRSKAYVAINGHGLYWEAGSFKRIFFMANDECNNGYGWNPTVKALPPLQEIVADPAHPLQWLLFCGHWGTSYEDYRHCSAREQQALAKGVVIYRTGSSPYGPATKDWWITEPCSSRHWIKRIFLPNAK
eukprot:m.212442 g.212442  ORF g.212442 m.212442 type:complete len:653 (+) comp20387_c0_seq1:250-2208(+)